MYRNGRPLKKTPYTPTPTVSHNVLQCWTNSCHQWLKKKTYFSPRKAFSTIYLYIYFFKLILLKRTPFLFFLILYMYIFVIGDKSMGIYRCQKTIMVYIEYIGAHRAVMIYWMYCQYCLSEALLSSWSGVIELNHVIGCLSLCCDFIRFPLLIT